MIHWEITRTTKRHWLISTSICGQLYVSSC